MEASTAATCWPGRPNVTITVLGEFRAVGSGGYRGVSDSEVEERGVRETNGQDTLIRADPVVIMWVRSEGVCRH